MRRDRLPRDRDGVIDQKSRFRWRRFVFEKGA
jgi:hypothetical protein